LFELNGISKEKPFLHSLSYSLFPLHTRSQKVTGLLLGINILTSNTIREFNTTGTFNESSATNNFQAMLTSGAALKIKRRSETMSPEPL